MRNEQRYAPLAPLLKEQFQLYSGDSIDTDAVSTNGKHHCYSDPLLQQRQDLGV